MDDADKPYFHLVIFSDLHLPGENLEAKEAVVWTVNSWGDVDRVISVGDICDKDGGTEEYSLAKEFFSQLKKPHVAIPGNHDFIYDWWTAQASGKAVPSARDLKLARFRDTFRLRTNYHFERLGNYLLIFLAPEISDHSVEMSGKQVRWLRTELSRNKKVPTIVFFHAPLKGTLRDYRSYINTPDFIAQPEGKIDHLLKENPQVFLWVSGHTHTPPTEESFASPVNIYDKRVTNIHNANMGRETIWTNSLFLYPGKVVVKTYDHKRGVWLDDLERTVPLPTASAYAKPPSKE